MDSFSVGLLVASQLIQDRVFDDFIVNRYKSYTEGIGLDIVEGRADFHTLESHALTLSQIPNESGREEHLKSILNQYLLKTLTEV